MSKFNTDEMRKEAKQHFAEYTRMGQRLFSALDEIDRLTTIQNSLALSIETRTKDAVWESILENCEPKTEYGPHGQHIEWYTADDIEQAIDSVGRNDEK